MVAHARNPWKVVLHVDEDGAWCASIPALPGCFSDGKTRDEAIKGIREAAEAWLEASRDLGLSVPLRDTQVEVAIVEA